MAPTRYAAPEQAPTHGKCPNCGACRCCGRTESQPIVIQPTLLHAQNSFCWCGQWHFNYVVISPYAPNTWRYAGTSFTVGGSTDVSAITVQ